MSRRFARRGFTTTELLVMIGLILLLLAILLPALSAVRTGGRMAKSQANLRQVGIYLTTYAQENREQIVPSQFDYSNDPYPGKVRSVSGLGSQFENRGTWADIIWSVNQLGVIPGMRSTAAGHDYSHSAPDDLVYREIPNYDKSPLRSAENNSRVMVSGDGDPTPVGTGARALDVPGYFAANSFFNADAGSAGFNGWYTMGQIPKPDKSVYLVDSFAGLVIDDDPAPWFTPEPATGTLEVDFRYGGQCLMLTLDGRVVDQNEWEDLDELETARYLYVQDLLNR